MTIPELARAVAKSMEDPHKWTTEHFARDKDNEPTDNVFSEAACRWCAVGHADKIVGATRVELTDKLREEFRHRYFTTLFESNDDDGREKTIYRLLALADHLENEENVK